jgi:hypothetical protein
MNLNGVQVAALHPQAKLFVNFLDAMLFEAVTHTQPSGRTDHIAMLIATYFGRRPPQADLSAMASCVMSNSMKPLKVAILYKELAGAEQ